MSPLPQATPQRSSAHEPPILRDLTWWIKRKTRVNDLFFLAEVGSKIMEFSLKWIFTLVSRLLIRLVASSNVALSRLVPACVHIKWWANSLSMTQQGREIFTSARSKAVTSSLWVDTAKKKENIYIDKQNLLDCKVCVYKVPTYLWLVFHSRKLLSLGHRWIAVFTIRYLCKTNWETISMSTAASIKESYL